MVKKLDTENDFVLALEINNEYTVDDVKEIEKWFQEKLDEGIDMVNILVRIDKLPVDHIAFKAFWEDGLYALRHIENCGHIAIVGHSGFEKFMVTFDGMVFNRAKEGIIEHYFDVEDIEEAWDFVNEDLEEFDEEGE